MSVDLLVYDVLLVYVVLSCSCWTDWFVVTDLNYVATVLRCISTGCSFDPAVRIVVLVSCLCSWLLLLGFLQLPSDETAAFVMVMVSC